MVDDLTLLLTSTCNLRCSYCPFPSHGGPGAAVGGTRLDRGRVLRAVDLYLAHAAEAPDRFRLLTFNADGEALLCRDDLLAGLERAAALRRELAVHGLILALVTNATLVDDAIADRLAALGVGVTVSLDGDASAHDRHRTGTGFAPSHAATVRGIGCLLRAGVPLRLRAVVTPETVDRLPETWAFLRSFGPGVPAKIRPVRLPGPDPLPPAWVDRYARAYLDLLEILLQRGEFVEHLPDEAAEAARSLATGQPRSPWCGTGRSMLWLTPGGTFTPCGLLSPDEDGLGYVDDLAGPADFAALVHQPPSQALDAARPEAREPCRSCPWRPACLGGCPVMAGRPGSLRPPPLCPLYRGVAERMARHVAGMPISADLRGASVP